MATLRRTPTNKNHPKIRMWVFLIIVVQLLLWLSPGQTAMYQCYDQSGSTVLTDNPVQLKDCSEVESSIVHIPSLPNNIGNSSNDHSLHSRHTSNEYRETRKESPLQKTPSTSDQDREITIPLQRMGGSFVVQANLNGQRTANLIVDTGATMTVLSTNIGIDLGILGTTDTTLLTINTAGGSVQVNMSYLSSLHVGRAKAKNVAVAIHDLPDMPEHIEGLLGMSFLKHFLITLDAAQARLILRPTSSS